MLEDYNIIKSNVGYMSVLSDNMLLPFTVCGFVFFLSQGGILIKQVVNQTVILALAVLFPKNRNKYSLL